LRDLSQIKVIFDAAAENGIANPHDVWSVLKDFKVPGMSEGLILKYLEEVKAGRPSSSWYDTVEAGKVSARLPRIWYLRLLGSSRSKVMRVTHSLQPLIITMQV